MAAVKTAVSLPAELFSRLEDLAREMKTTRSGLMALAIEQFLRRRAEDSLVERINAAYADGGLDAEDEAWLEAANQHFGEAVTRAPA